MRLTNLIRDTDALFRSRAHVQVIAKGIAPFLLSILFTSPAFSQNIDDLFKDDKTRIWSEIEVLLPDFPKVENLISFDVGAVQDKHFFIDEASFSVGKDEVLRYTLVIESASGAQTITYEGLRCETAERRVYAFGHAQEKRWRPPRKSVWTSVLPGANVYATLVGTYFCPIAGETIFSVEDAKRALKTH